MIFAAISFSNRTRFVKFSQGRIVLVGIPKVSALVVEFLSELDLLFLVAEFGHDELIIITTSKMILYYIAICPYILDNGERGLRVEED
jgi:hypothetical protein